MNYQEYRCRQCNKLLFKGLLVDSEVEVKCRGCAAINTFRGVSKDKLLCFKEICQNRVTNKSAQPGHNLAVE